ncbi:hypothetical protein BT638P5_00008 [Bacteroides phage BT638P5]|nr:hypothetical protein BT638P5_00008 [Bacteroides phage BT638P5]
MKIRFLDTDQTITGTAGTHIAVPGFQVLHYNKPCLVKLNILDDEPLNSWVEDASAVVDNLPGATVKLPIFEGNIIDLSVMASYFLTFQKELALFPTKASRTVTMNFTVNPKGAVKYYYFRVYVMNIDAPNVLKAKAMYGTDFLNGEGVRVPVAHAFNDQFWFTPILATTDLEYELNDGEWLVYGKQGDNTIPDIHGTYSKIEVRNDSTSDLLLRKYYAPLVPSDCAITFRWLNTTGSMDYVSCYNWTVTPTIRRDSLGGTVTKNEIQAIFPVNNDNLNALSRLAVSPDIQIKGLLPDDKSVRAIGATTSGVKITASGLNRTITLKFVY